MEEARQLGGNTHTSDPIRKLTYRPVTYTVWILMTLSFDALRSCVYAGYSLPAPLIQIKQLYVL